MRHPSYLQMHLLEYQKQCGHRVMLLMLLIDVLINVARRNDPATWNRNERTPGNSCGSLQECGQQGVFWRRLLASQSPTHSREPSKYGRKATFLCQTKLDWMATSILSGTAPVQSWAMLHNPESSCIVHMLHSSLKVKWATARASNHRYCFNQLKSWESV
ncbi:uncharacterized protein J5F26_011885 isoform 2-T11 [Ciconia maguari]